MGLAPLQRNGPQFPGVGARANRNWLPLLSAAVLGLLLSVYVLRVLSMPAEWVPLLLMGVFATFVAVVVGNTRKLLLVVIALGVPFSVNINLFFREDMAAMNAVSGLYVSATTLALIVLYGLWLLDAVAGRRSGPRFIDLAKGNLSVVLYVGIVVLSLVVARDRMLGFFEVSLILQVFFLYIYLVYALQTKADIMFVVTLLLLGLAIESLIMMALPLIGDDVTIMSVRARIDDGGRVGGTVGGPNGAGAFLTLLIAPSLGFLISQVGRFRKLLALGCVFTGTAALILTLSRGGWLGFGISCGVFSFVAWRRKWVPGIAFVGLAVGAMLVAFVFQDLILTRLTQPDGGAAYARWPLMQIAAAMIVDQPFLGVGANNFVLYVSEYATGPLASEWLNTVHNRYLLLWAESGIFALVFFLFFLGSTLRRGWRGYLRNDRVLSPISLGMTAGVLGFMVHMNVDILRSGPPMELFWVMAALMACIDRVLEREAMDGQVEDPMLLSRSRKI